MFDPLATDVNFFRPPALRQRNSVFCEASGPTGNIERLGPVGGWGNVLSLLWSDYQGSLKGHHDHSLLSSTVFLVVNRHGTPYVAIPPLVYG